MTLVVREVSWLVKKLSFKVTLWGMLLWMMLNYIQTLIRYWGTDISVLPEAMEFRLASSHNFSWMPLLMELFPFIVVLPAAFVFLNDDTEGTAVYLKARLGQKKYYLMKLLSVFFTTFLAFAIPMLAEVVLFLVAFPGGKIGDITYISPYLKGNMYENMLFSDVYYSGDLPYAILGAVTFCFMAAILACFAAAVSTWGMKLKILLFLPVYLLLNGLSILNHAFVLPIQTGYQFYLIYYDSLRKSLPGFLCVQLVIVMLTMALLFIRINIDDLGGKAHGQA